LPVCRSHDARAVISSSAIAIQAAGLLEARFAPFLLNA
jgi:hypothetical protein